MKHETIEAIRNQVDQYGSDGACDIRLCFRCDIYFSHFRQEAIGVNHFYQTILPLIRESVRFYDVDGKHRPKKIKPDVFEMLPYWSQQHDEGRSIWGLELESGTTKEDISDRSFRFFSMYLGAGSITLCLPLESILCTDLDVTALLTDATNKLHFLHGIAGVGINIASGYPSSFEEFAVYAISRRYRGLEASNPGWFHQYAAQGIAGVNWLTLLGSELVAQLGGPAVLEPLRTEAVSCHVLAHGLLVQAGAHPSFGDVNRGDTLDAYHAVGRALRSLRVKTGRIERWDGIGGHDNTQEWLARFDD